ncbi:MAG: CAP domain-containing protein [Nitrospirota bacterium]
MIHTLINRERGKRGLSQLAADNDLARIARGHSKDMASRRYFSHDSPEGHDFSFRYRQEGYTCSLRIGNTVHMGAENIFLNVRYNSVTTVNRDAYYDWNSEEQIAETTVRGWMDSPGHRKNILTPHWRNEGIGVFLSPDDKIYITQNFC